jgi:hypothetical protein
VKAPQTANRFALRAFNRAASSSRLFVGALVSSFFVCHSAAQRRNLLLDRLHSIGNFARISLAPIRACCHRSAYSVS